MMAKGLDKIDFVVNSVRNEALEFLKRLICIQTVNPPGSNYSELTDIVDGFLKKNCLETEIHAKNDKPNLLAKWDVGSKNTLHINSHYDVVPVGNQWRHKPFVPVVEDGKLFGRGSADAKSNICVTVYALKVMKELGIQPACNIECSFTCDEESGGIDGLGYLVKEKIVNPTFGIVADGPVNGISNAQKGVLALKITVVGKSAHAGWPHKGINAFLGACKLAHRLDETNKVIGKMKSECDTDEEIEKSPTLVPGGKTEGGTKFNMVPDEFSFTVDRRIIPEENLEEGKKQIDDIISQFCEEYSEYKVNVNTVLEARPAYSDKNSIISRVLSRSIKLVKGQEPRYLLLPTFLDMRYLVNDAKIHCVSYGTRGANQHGDDEFVYTDSIFENIKVWILAATSSELD